MDENDNIMFYKQEVSVMEKSWIFHEPCIKIEIKIKSWASINIPTPTPNMTQAKVICPKCSVDGREICPSTALRGSPAPI